MDLRSLGNGRYLMPVLDPARDSLPFAMALELHERTSGAEDNCPSLLWGQAQPEEGLYALRYMLDCEPQVCLTRSYTVLYSQRVRKRSEGRDMGGEREREREMCA